MVTDDNSNINLGILMILITDRFMSTKPLPDCSGIYGIYSEGSGSWYIGMSKNIKGRIKRHFCALSNKRHRNKHLQSSFNKYKGKSFYVTVLEICSVEILSHRERIWIQRQYAFHDGFNMTDGGEGGKMNEEVKHRISQSLKGRKRPLFSDEWRSNMSKERKTRTVSDTTKEKISKALRGRNITWGNKISKAKRGRR